MAWLAGQRITVQRLLDNTPRTISYTSITANTASVTAETVWITSGSITFRTGRAYRCTLKCLLQGNAADKATVRIRKANLSGDVYLDSFHQGIQVSTSNTMFYGSNICSNTSGADVTAAVVGTLQRSSGSTANVAIAATTTHVAYMEVEDIGDASDFSGARAIT